MTALLILISLILAGCQIGQHMAFRQTGEPIMVMATWVQYQACFGTSDLEAARSVVDQLSRRPLRGVDPPAWTKILGVPVAAQPLRVAVDPRALGADCALRAARLAREGNLLDEAQARYRDIIRQYADSEYAYYVDQARLALIDLQDRMPPLIARTSTSPH